MVNVIRAALLAMSGLLVFVLAYGCAAHNAVRPAAAVPKPNIILIMTDDQDYASVRHMPNVQNLLAEKGTVFTNAFVSTPLCCPSRATFLRGQYAHNHGVITNEAPSGGLKRFRELQRERSTVATWLDDAGYRTVLLGKYLNEYEGTRIPPGWDDWYARTHGFASGGEEFQLSINGRLVNFPVDEYNSDDVLGRKAMGYIRRSADSGRPFFMYLAAHAPHKPAESAPRYDDMFLDEPLPLPPNFNEEDVSDKPSWVQALKPIGRGRTERLELYNQQRLRSIQSVDALVKDLVVEIAKAGKLDNTFFVFTNDNGWHQGEHRRGAGKGTAYEESIRVPFIVRGPGVPEGLTLEHLVLNNDFAPTAADLAGARTPGFVDGKSMLPLLGTSPPSPGEWRDQVLIEHPGRTGPHDFLAVRTQTAKYVRYKNGEKELYELDSDPYEMESQHQNNPELLSDMKAHLKRLKDCAADSCHDAENP